MSIRLHARRLATEAAEKPGFFASALSRFKKRDPEPEVAPQPQTEIRKPPEKFARPRTPRK